jgi:endonuclease/exonuclease/phosphatase family metal-dependent hydrolase
MFLLASTLGGGWFYFGGAPQQTQTPFGQSPGGFNSPVATTSNYPAASLPAAPVVPSPTIFGGRAPQPQQGGPAIRIASFNIQVFGDEKAKKPYVMQTLAMAIRNFHVVAIQEIRTQNGYFLDSFLRDYVNATGVNADGKHYYDYVIGPRLGRSNSKEQYAFIYDTTAVEVNRQSIYTVNDPQDLMHREPLVALFRVRGPAPNEAFTFVLVNVHTDPDETKEELDALADVYHAVRQASGGEDDIIILGDLNVDDQHLGRLGKIPGVRPIVTRVFTNTRQNKLYDNIVVHQSSTAEFTGRWGVFDVRQLTNPPLTLEQALMMSDHLPVWAEFSAYESAAPGRVAARPGAAATLSSPSPR